MADEETSAALAAANAGLAEVERSLNGTGERVWKTWRELTSTVTALPSIGADAAKHIGELRANDALPIDHRTRVINETHDGAVAIIEALRKQTNDQVEQFEQALAESLMPVTNRDPGQRMLVRQEVDRVVGNATGAALLQRMVSVIGRNPSWDAELLSDHGRALMEGSGAGEHWKTFRDAAVGKLINTQGGTPKQQAARNALVAVRKTNLRGRTVTYAQAARLRLR